MDMGIDIDTNTVLMRTPIPPTPLLNLEAPINDQVEGHYRRRVSKGTLHKPDILDIKSYTTAFMGFACCFSPEASFDIGRQSQRGLSKKESPFKGPKYAATEYLDPNIGARCRDKSR